MEISVTHTSELKVRKLQALNYMDGKEFPVLGDKYIPSIGEQCEIAKQRVTPSWSEALGAVFKKTQEHNDLKNFVDILELQDTLFDMEETK